MQTKEIRKILKSSFENCSFYNRIKGVTIVGSFSEDRLLYCNDEVDILLVVDIIDVGLLKQIHDWAKDICKKHTNNRNWRYTFKNGPYKEVAYKPTLLLQILLDPIEELGNYPPTFLKSFEKKHEVLLGKFLYPKVKQPTLKSICYQKRNLIWWIDMIKNNKTFYFEWIQAGNEVKIDFKIIKIPLEQTCEMALSVLKKEFKNLTLAGYKPNKKIREEVEDLLIYEDTIKSCKKFKKPKEIINKIVSLFERLHKSSLKQCK